MVNELEIVKNDGITEVAEEIAEKPGFFEKYGPVAGGFCAGALIGFGAYKVYKFIKGKIASAKEAKKTAEQKSEE